MAPPMLTKLSAMTPKPTQRCMPTVSPFCHADAALTTGTPLLAVAEPALLLLAFTIGALGGAIGNADALDALCLGGSLVLGGVECGVRRRQMWCASQQCL